MVHHTISSSSTSAPKASSRISTMKRLLCNVVCGAIVGTLAACGSLPLPYPVPATTAGATPPGRLTSVPPALQQGRSRWVAVPWSELPGVEQDSLHEAWNAWLKSCERPTPALAALCPEVRRLSIGSAPEQLAWLTTRLQPYRVEALGDDGPGLLTAYFEPVFEASRQSRPGFVVPLYQPPAGLAQRKPWYTRQEIDTLPAAQAALKGREIAFLADPVDALILQIQGSGRLRVTDPDGQVRLLRVAYATNNEQPYKSVGRWLLDQGALRDASWPGIRAWIAQNPQRVQELLWSNPRVVFFREEALSELDAGFGPRGAQGVALTPGRSIAVDPSSIPYGTPVWLASSGAAANLERLVLAQDTGSAIVGAVRADYFAGWGAQAGELAGRLKQPLRLWVLWPK
ncbi:MAG: MltA domain-containing protein [Rhodoferax sp.]|nr:MltA domain-containing protein [Rhodoferax sp.]